MPTVARIATVAQNGQFENTLAANREYIMGLLDEAVRLKPDLVCLPEAFTNQGVTGPLSEKAETVPGPSTDAAARRARESLLRGLPRQSSQRREDLQLGRHS